MPETDPPDTPALNAWIEHPYHSGRDSTKVRLWFPSEAPYALLDTISRGCDQPDILPDPEKPTVHVHLGTTISIGGYLSEMEQYFAAVVEALKVARWQADTMAAEQAKEGSDDG